MKNLLIITLFFIFLYGCGETDNPITNNPPPPVNNDSLYFSVDLIEIQGTGNQFADTSFLDGRNVNHIKVQFTLETNCTSADNAGLTLNFMNHQNHIISRLDSLNGTYTFEETRAGTNFASFSVEMYKFSSTNKYLRFKNFKYYKVLN